MLDPSHALQSAARAFARHVAPHALVTRVTLHDQHGVIAALPVLPGPEPEAEKPAVPAAPPEGWDFSQAVPRFDGQVVTVHGRKQSLLRALAEADRPLTVDKLLNVWEAQVEPCSIRWQIAELRKVLKAVFPEFEGDPIVSSPEGYLLQLR